MPIIFPTFKGSPCSGLELCAALSAEDPNVLESLGELHKEPLVASYKSGDMDVFVQVRGGEKTAQNHINIDIYKNEILAPGWRPRTTVSREQLADRLEFLMGQEVNLSILSYYLVDFKDLPKRGFPGLIGLKLKEGELALTLTSASFEIDGAPIRFLVWRSLDRGKRVRIELEASSPEKIKQNYISKNIKFMDAQFRTLFAGGK